jgi:hypothetical protein
VILAPAKVSAQDVQQNTFSDLVVTGTATTGAIFQGTLDITRFTVQNGQIVAIGVLNGTLGGFPVTNEPVALPVTFGQHSCTILELTLGPLDLNLLGLMVHLDEVHLEITAQPGSGNLLGNLLCQIAGLLDNNASLKAIVDKLNQLIRILG